MSTVMERSGAFRRQFGAVYYREKEMQNYTAFCEAFQYIKA